MKDLLHVSFPVAPRLLARFHARVSRRLSRWHGLRSAGDRPALLLQVAAKVPAEILNSPTSSSAAKLSSEGCSCTTRVANLGRIARAAQRANQVLSVAPISLESILSLVPRAPGPKSTLLLQAMAAGVSLCDLIMDEIGSREASSEPCRRCQRRPRVS